MHPEIHEVSERQVGPSSSERNRRSGTWSRCGAPFERVPHELNTAVSFHKNSNQASERNISRYFELRAVESNMHLVFQKNLKAPSIKALQASKLKVSLNFTVI